MKIETKFDMGQEVFYISDNQVTKTYITNIDISVDKENKKEVIYCTDSSSHFYEDAKYIEDMLFGTVDELLDYLRGHVESWNTF